MLTPSYLNSSADYLLGMYDALNTAIVEDVARRIMKTGRITATANYQIKAAQEAGLLMDEIILQIAYINNASDDEIKRIFNAAGMKSIRNDASPLISIGRKVDLRLSDAMQRKLDAAILKTQGNLKNLTLTTATSASGLYTQAVNQAYMEAMSGAFSYNEAIRRAIKRAAIDGSDVIYDSGRTAKLDVAVRTSVITGVNQTSAKLTEMFAEDMGAEYYETTAHAGSRPSHAEWQGRIFKIEGSSLEYPNFEESTGYGTAGGLCGVNCRHSFHPFWPGISVPGYSKKDLRNYDIAKHRYNGEWLTEYDCTQKQRAYERKIREYKRVLAGYDAAISAGGDPEVIGSLKDDFSKVSVKLKSKERELKDFCKQTDRRYDSSRTQVIAHKDGSGKIVNFGHSQSMKAVWANKKRGA